MPLHVLVTPASVHKRPAENRSYARLSYGACVGSAIDGSGQAGLTILLGSEDPQRRVSSIRATAVLSPRPLWREAAGHADIPAERVRWRHGGCNERGVPRDRPSPPPLAGAHRRPAQARPGAGTAAT